MPRYRKHVFVCTNVREGKQACTGERYVAAMRKLLDERGVSKDDVRVNRTGCLGQCAKGPTIVVYPEGVWYGGVKDSDLEEIVNSHIIDGVQVERLRIE